MVNADVLKAALAALPSDESPRIFSSDSVPNARTAVTKFSTALTGLLLAQLPQDGSPYTLRASFKGSKGGRSGGKKGGLKDLTAFANSQVKTPHSFEKGELLLDFLVSRQEILEVVLTCESEATPIRKGDDSRDLDKLLLVSSPRRVFVGRVNLTKTRKQEKPTKAKDMISSRLQVAAAKRILKPDDVFYAVLLQTSVQDGVRICHIAQCTGGDAQCRFTEVDLGFSG